MLNGFPDDAPALRRPPGDQQTATVTYSDEPGDDQAGPPVSLNAGQKQTIKAAIPIKCSAIASAAQLTIEAPFQPTAWWVQVRNKANVEIQVHAGGSRGESPHAELGPGGWCLLPGVSTQLTLYGAGATTVTPVVVAYQGWTLAELGGAQCQPGGTVA